MKLSEPWKSLDYITQKLNLAGGGSISWVHHSGKAALPNKSGAFNVLRPLGPLLPGGHPNSIIVYVDKHSFVQRYSYRIFTITKESTNCP